MERAARPGHAQEMKPANLPALVLLCGLLLAGCASVPPPGSPASPPLSARELTERRCGACHAVALDDTSPNPSAPPLRDMFKRYPVYALGEALRKGIEVGHRDMPRFTLDADETAAIIAYLDSLNPCAKPSSDDAAMERCFGPM